MGVLELFQVQVIGDGDGEGDGRVVTAGVFVAEQLAGFDGVTVAVALPDRHPQRRHHQLDVLAGRRVPGDDLLGEHVDDERHVDGPDPRPEVGEVRRPGPVWRRSSEVPVEQVPGTPAVLARDRGPEGGLMLLLMSSGVHAAPWVSSQAW